MAKLRQRMGNAKESPHKRHKLPRNKTVECVVVETTSDEHDDTETTVSNYKRKIRGLESESKKRKTEVLTETVRKSARSGQKASIEKIKEWTKSSGRQRRSSKDISPQVSVVSVVSQKKDLPARSQENSKVLRSSLNSVKVIEESPKPSRTKRRSIDDISSQDSVVSVRETYSRSTRKAAVEKIKEWTKSTRYKRKSIDDISSQDSVVCISENSPKKCYSTRSRKNSAASLSSSHDSIELVEKTKNIPKKGKMVLNPFNISQKENKTENMTKTGELLVSLPKLTAKQMNSIKSLVAKSSGMTKNYKTSPSACPKNSNKTENVSKSTKNKENSNKSPIIITRKSANTVKNTQISKISENVVDLITPIKKVAQNSAESDQKTPIYRSNNQKDDEKTTDDIYDFLSLSQDSDTGNKARKKHKPKIRKVAKKPKMKPTKTKMWDLDNTQMKKVLKTIPLPKIRPKTMVMPTKAQMTKSPNATKQQIEVQNRPPQILDDDDNEDHFDDASPINSPSRRSSFASIHEANKSPRNMNEDYYDVSPLESPKHSANSPNQRIEQWRRSITPKSPVSEMPSPTSPPKIVETPNPIKPVHRMTSTPLVGAKIEKSTKLAKQVHRMTSTPLENGAASPWRVQDESVLPRTFYFSRATDLCPSYDSDMVYKSPEQEKQDKLQKIKNSAEILRAHIAEKQRLLEQLEQSKARLQNNNSTLNDSNLENMIPVAVPKPNSAPKPKTRSPLKSLPINVAHYASPVNSPLATKTFSPAKRIQMPVIEVNDSHDTLFGFDDSEYVDETNSSLTINQTTLKEKLKNIRKFAPAKRPSLVATRPVRYDVNTINSIFKSPLKQQPRINELIYGSSTSTPNVQGAKKAKKVIETLENTEISAIQSEEKVKRVKTPNLFDDLEEMEGDKEVLKMKEKPRRSYTRQPRRKRRPNNNRPHYLLEIGLSEDEYESDEEELEETEQKKRKVTTKKKKEKSVEETAEFKDFVREMNKEFDEVDKYELVIV